MGGETGEASSFVADRFLHPVHSTSLANGISRVGSRNGGDIRLPYPVRLFFELDPLAGLSNALASHALYRGLLWSLVIVVGTLFFGRFFCGWICPMGSIHHFFGKLAVGEQARQATGGVQPLQALAGHEVLCSIRGAGGLGPGFGTGWLD